MKRQDKNLLTPNRYMKLVFGLSFILITLLASGQAGKHMITVYEKFSDINRKNGMEAKNITQMDNQASVSIKMPDGKRLIKEHSQVWGFKSKDGRLYRNTLNSFYRIEGTSDSIILYSHATKGYRGRRVIHYYFSKAGNENIASLTMQNLMSHYRFNPCVLEAISHYSWPNNLAKFNYKTSCYYLVELIQSCVKKLS
jgi:hypothetical protein